MFNSLFWIAVIVGMTLRIFDGKVISIAVGLCVGILISEAWKFLVWYYR